MAIPFFPEPAPVTPSDPLPTDYEKIERHIRESRYMILEDIGNIEEKIETLEQSVESVYAKTSELLESNNRLELRVTSLEALLREALAALRLASPSQM